MIVKPGAKELWKAWYECNADVLESYSANQKTKHVQLRLNPRSSAAPFRKKIVELRSTMRVVEYSVGGANCSRRSGSTTRLRRPMRVPQGKLHKAQMNKGHIYIFIDDDPAASRRSAANRSTASRIRFVIPGGEQQEQLVIDRINKIIQEL
jgi:hypothetical protein